ncbi:MAG: beta-lactamase family protein [Bacteroidetes bacterium]|nr:beta-lactamase family protein [Bacteroidota bacterium]
MNYKLSIILFLISVLFNTLQPAKSFTLFSDQRLYSDIFYDEIDTFNVELERDKFLFASLFQFNTDLIVNIYSPENKLLSTFDYLTSGPEFITLTTKTKGLYKIIVAHFNPMDEKGSYSIGIEKLEPAAESSEEKVDQLLSEWRVDYRPGGFISIVKGDSVVLSKGYGMADLEHKRTIDNNTPSNLCSLSKHFTAFAVLLLEEKGLLSIDDDITKYLPEMITYKGKIKIKNLIFHNSGLREMADLLGLTGEPIEGPFTKQDLYKLIYSQKELNFESGEKFLYCNTGYILLAEIISRITHKPFSQWIKENIFSPLNMSNTFIYSTTADLPKKIANSYKLGNKGSYEKISLKDLWYTGAGSTFTTAEDMCRWMLNFNNPVVGSKKTFNRFKNNGIIYDSLSNSYYGYGLVNGTYKGLNYYWHGGGGNGYTSYMMWFPEFDFSVAVLSNFVYGGVYYRAQTIADIFLESKFTNPEFSGDYKNKKKPIIVHPDIFDNYTGIYTNNAEFTVEVSRDNNNLVVQRIGQEKTKYFPLSEEKYFIKENGSEAKFVKSGSGIYNKLIVYFDKDSLVLTRQVNNVWKNYDEYTGKYFSKELGITYFADVVNKTLTLKNIRNINFPLIHIWGDIYKDKLYSHYNVQFTRDGNSNIINFLLDSPRSKNIKFVKVE